MLEKNNNIPVTVENIFVTKNTFAEHGNEIEEIISKKPPMDCTLGNFTVVFLPAIYWYDKLVY